MANAVGGKTVRGCDSCITKRARWYCADDDAFLCQVCDSSVHSANPLARRHERVRLKTGSFKPSDEGHVGQLKNSTPSWHRGFTEKARTPRHGRHSSTNYQTSKSEEDEEELASRNANPFYLVPEVVSDENLCHEENEAQLLYRVPIFYPFMSKLCASPYGHSADHAIAGSTGGKSEVGNKGTKGNESKTQLAKEANGGMVDNLHSFIPSDIELAEFAADVESLLGRGLENECTGMEELGLVDTQEEDSRECSVGIAKVKVEEEVANEEDAMAVQGESDKMDMAREPYELNFDYDSFTTYEAEEKASLGITSTFQSGGELEGQGSKKKILLNLDYGAVITAWSSQSSSPWTNGDRPNIDPNDCWPHCMGTCGIEVHHPYAEFGGLGRHPAMLDGGREARVSRYKEKRRTRLFSKKIRYEVRKLNAEKRPRMKGRFVKRASFAVPGFPLLAK